MLKKRVIATIIIKNKIVVQSINFDKYLPIGSPIVAIEFLNNWGIDEIILLDIDTTKNKCEPNYELVQLATQKCFVPITIGGGINCIDQISKLMHSGADKISLNYSALHNEKLVTNAAKIFGNQCIVVSIDAIKIGNKYLVYDYINKSAINLEPSKLAFKVANLGAGEILINSVDRDGCYIGYDLDLINSVCNAVNIPVICSGGAKNANDFIEVFQMSNVSGASAANLFHFNEHSVNITKKSISDKINIRIETQANYLNSTFDDMFRLQKKQDEVLEKLLFTKIDKEII
jgi:cyclase